MCVCVCVCVCACLSIPLSVSVSVCLSLDLQVVAFGKDHEGEDFDVVHAALRRGDILCEEYTAAISPMLHFPDAKLL